MRHAGNVRAPDRELAMHYAREFYSRRNESVRLWVVPRTEITDLSDPDLLQPPLDRIVQEARRLRDARQARGGQAPRGEARAPNDRARPDARRGSSSSPTCRRSTLPRSMPELRAALAELLLTMADDEFVIGFRDSEWTGIAPMLEEDVAFSSLAQDEIGHARLLYEMRGALTGEDPDRLAFHRATVRVPPRAAARPPAPGTGASRIARRWLYDTADSVRLAALARFVASRRSPRSWPRSGARSATT